MMKKNLAIILAGGTGSRMEGDLPKQFLTLAGKTILQIQQRRFKKEISRIHREGARIDPYRDV